MRILTENQKRYIIEKGEIMSKNESAIKELIYNDKFEYDQPWFYNNTYALRCELGIGKGNRDYLKNAVRRAQEIFDILFSDGVDAVFIDWFIYDRTTTAFSKKDIDIILEYERKEMEYVRPWLKYRDCDVLFNRNDYYTEELILRKRIICPIPQNARIDFKKKVKELATCKAPLCLHFVSYKNECIYSVYDDRGCDIVFANQEKLKEFYVKLEKYLLPYDLEEMKKRADL